VAQQHLEQGVELAQSNEEYATAIEEAEWLARSQPEVEGVKELLERLVEARDKTAQPPAAG
jgi:hypothetical protein